MAAAAKKTTSKRKAGVKRTATKRGATKKSTSKSPAKKNKLGVKNSLVNNINAHKEKGDSKSRKKSTVSKKAYQKMEQNWGRDKA